MCSFFFNHNFLRLLEKCLFRKNYNLRTSSKIAITLEVIVSNHMEQNNNWILLQHDQNFQYLWLLFDGSLRIDTSFNVFCISKELNSVISLKVNAVKIRELQSRTLLPQQSEMRSRLVRWNFTECLVVQLN